MQLTRPLQKTGMSPFRTARVLPQAGPLEVSCNLEITAVSHIQSGICEECKSGMLSFEATPAVYFKPVSACFCLTTSKSQQKWQASSATCAGHTESTRGTGHHHTGGLSASGVRGLDVQPGEVIDRKYYTGTENRPQEQALGIHCSQNYVANLCEIP